jgi:hypothetical protein
MSRWRRLGRVFAPKGQQPWMMSHASAPFAERVEGDRYRIYFTSRDADNRSHIGWLELDITRPDRVLRLCDRPVLAPGAIGRCDDRGAMMSWLTAEGGRRRLYYVAWNVRQPVPYHPSVGMAEEARGGGFTALPGPVLERNPVDPYFCSNPCVLVENGLWRMWYLSGLGWETTPTGLSPSYEVRYAESDDGIAWRRSGKAAIELDADAGEYAIARPSVLREAEGYAMWFCVRRRDRPYRLGMARSVDGIHWRRADDQLGLEPATDGWDSEMIAYPHVFDHGADRYMLYCGNGFGRTGFGCAVLEL